MSLSDRHPPRTLLIPKQPIAFNRWRLGSPIEAIDQATGLTVAQLQDMQAGMNLGLGRSFSMPDGRSLKAKSKAIDRTTGLTIAQLQQIQTEFQ